MTKKVLGGAYYRDPRYRDRRDCAYEWHGDRLRVRPDAKAHEDGQDTERDVGLAPFYPKAIVLLARRFVYFGKRASTDYRRNFPAIATALEKGMRGHRVNHPPALREQLLGLRDQVIERHGECATLAAPFHADDTLCTPCERVRPEWMPKRRTGPGRKSTSC